MTSRTRRAVQLPVSRTKMRSRGTTVILAAWMLVGCSGGPDHDAFRSIYVEDLTSGDKFVEQPKRLSDDQIDSAVERVCPNGKLDRGEAETIAQTILGDDGVELIAYKMAIVTAVMRTTDCQRAAVAEVRYCWYSDAKRLSVTVHDQQDRSVTLPDPDSSDCLNAEDFPVGSAIEMFVRGDYGDSTSCTIIVDDEPQISADAAEGANAAICKGKVK